MISHHPANLDFANNQAGSKIPTYGYALVYPLLLIGKIVFVQLLWQFCRCWAGEGWDIGEYLLDFCVGQDTS